MPCLLILHLHRRLTSCLADIFIFIYTYSIHWLNHRIIIGKAIIFQKSFVRIALLNCFKHFINLFLGFYVLLFKTKNLILIFVGYLFLCVYRYILN